MFVVKYRSVNVDTPNDRRLSKQKSHVGLQGHAYAPSIIVTISLTIPFKFPAVFAIFESS